MGFEWWTYKVIPNYRSSSCLYGRKSYNHNALPKLPHLYMLATSSNWYTRLLLTQLKGTSIFRPFPCRGRRGRAQDLRTIGAWWVTVDGPCVEFNKAQKEYEQVESHLMSLWGRGRERGRSIRVESGGDDERRGVGLRSGKLGIGLTCSRYSLRLDCHLPTLLRALLLLTRLYRFLFPF